MGSRRPLLPAKHLQVPDEQNEYLLQGWRVNMGITIDKAIEILSEKVKHPYIRTRLAYPDALKLGIEALKVTLKAREGNYASFKLLLPGETKE